MALDATLNTQQEQHDQQQDEKGHNNRLSNYLSNLLYNNKNLVIKNKRDLTNEYNCKNGGNFNFILNDEDQPTESRIITKNDFQQVELR